MSPFLDRLRRPTVARGLAATLAAVGWSALAVEFCFLWNARHPPSVMRTALEFLSFFTVISNLLVATLLTRAALRPADRPPGPRPARVAAAAVVYISMTGLVYTLLLRQSHGDVLGWAVDIALHQLIPVGYCLLWLANRDPRSLSRRDAFLWLILPLAFAGAALLRGALTGEYTYPFLNPARLGYALVTLNILLLSVPFLGLALVVVRVSGAGERHIALRQERRT